MDLPALSSTPRAMTEALDRVAGEGTSKLISCTEDPAVTSVVGSWPAQMKTDRAARLGLTADMSSDDIIREYLADNPVS
jgi:hypothetical protein